MHKKTILFGLFIAAFSNITAEAQQKIDDHREKSGKNAITFNFPQFASITDVPFIEIGAEYERFIDRRNCFSISGTFYGGLAPEPNEGTNSFGALGFRFYPERTRKGDISIGIQFASGVSSIKTDYSRGNYASGKIAAILIQSDFNLHPTPHGLVGLHIAVGPDFNEGLLIQFGFKVGGRF